MDNQLYPIAGVHNQMPSQGPAVVNWDLSLDPDINYAIINHQCPQNVLDEALNESAALPNSKTINIEWVPGMPLIHVSASNGRAVSTKDVLLALYYGLHEPLYEKHFEVIESWPSDKLTAMNTAWKRRCAATIDPRRRTLAEFHGAFCVDTLSYQIYSHIQCDKGTNYKLYLRPKQ